MKIRSLLLTGLLGGLMLQATEARAQSLEEALAATYQNNPTLLAGRASLRATDEAVPQALANWRPNVEVTASYGRTRVYNNTSTPEVQNRQPADWGVSLTQPLFRGGRTLAATSSAENNVKAQRANLTSTEQTVLLDAISAYLNVYRDQATVELNKSNERVLQRQLEATQDRFAVGEITRTDVHQAEARLARATADRIQSEGNLEASRANYENIIGLAPGALEVVGVPDDLLPVSLEDSVKIALGSNPDLINAEFTAKAAVDDADEVWGELMPTLELNASATRAHQSSSEVSRVDTLSATVDLTVPLYQQGDVYSRLREARQTIAEARGDVDQGRRDAIEAATASWQGLQSARAQVEAIKSQIVASEVALEGVQREAAVGSRTVLDVLDAEQERLDANVSLVQAERDLVVAAYELLSAMGKLTAADLNLGVDLYDPYQHYDEVRDKWFGGRSSGQAE
ncbi:MAG: TolC family outer membrane protein [Rhodospirillales bacterium]